MRVYLQTIVFIISLLFSTNSVAQREALSLKQDSLAIDLLIKQSDTLSKSHLDSSLQLAQKALESGEAIQNYELINRAFNQIGIIYRFKGELDSASIQYHNGLKICEKLDDSLCMAKSWHNLGVISRKKGAFTEALDYELRSIPFLEMAKDSIAIGHVYNSLGNIYNVQENWDKAIECYHKGLLIQQAVRNETGVWRLLYNLGATHYQLDQLSLADSMFQASLIYAKKLNNKRALANTYHSLGVIEQELSNYIKAKDYFEESAILHKEMQDKEGLVFIQLSLGELHDLNQKWNLSEASYREALSLALYTGLKEVEIAARKSLALSLEKQGKLEEALQEMKTYSLLKDTLRDESTGEQILELQEKYESNKKEQENLLLSKENEIKEKQLEAKSQSLIIRNLILGVLAVILILSIVLLLNYRKRIQTERLIANHRSEINRKKMLDLIQDQELAYMNATLIGQETERNRIAADLHDGLSNMMVTVKLYFENLGGKISKQDPQLNDKYQEAISMFDDLCKRARTLAHEMSSQQSKFNLKSALNEVVAIINKTGQLQVELSIFGLENTYTASFENEVFHILRELMGNCLKHAEAKKMFIQLTDHDYNLNIMIEDDGKGFDLKKIKENGIGLSNLENRIQKFDGNMFIDSALGRGTAITIDLPTTTKLST